MRRVLRDSLFCEKRQPGGRDDRTTDVGGPWRLPSHRQWQLSSRGQFVAVSRPFNRRAPRRPGYSARTLLDGNRVPAKGVCPDGAPVRALRQPRWAFASVGRRPRSLSGGSPVGEEGLNG